MDKNKTVYLAPREIKSTGRTYNNKTYEYTHGMNEELHQQQKAQTVETLNMFKRCIRERSKNKYFRTTNILWFRN